MRYGAILSLTKWAISDLFNKKEKAITLFRKRLSLQEQQELDVLIAIELIEIPYTIRDEEIKTLLKNRLNDYLAREQG